MKSYSKVNFFDIILTVLTISGIVYLIYFFAFLPKDNSFLNFIAIADTIVLCGSSNTIIRYIRSKK